jgi:hypothetical protein
MIPLKRLVKRGSLGRAKLSAIPRPVRDVLLLFSPDIALVFLRFALRSHRRSAPSRIAKAIPTAPEHGSTTYTNLSDNPSRRVSPTRTAVPPPPLRGASYRV